MVPRMHALTARSDHGRDVRHFAHARGGGYAAWRRFACREPLTDAALSQVASFGLARKSAAVASPPLSQQLRELP
jgi:hypothetical protein